MQPGKGKATVGTSAKDLTHSPGGVEKITPGRGGHLNTRRTEGTERVSEEGLLRGTQRDRKNRAPVPSLSPDGQGRSVSVVG